MTITGQILNLTYYFKTDLDLWLPAFRAHQLTQTITLCKLFNSFKTNSTCFMVCLNKTLHDNMIVKIIIFIIKFSNQYFQYIFIFQIFSNQLNDLKIIPFIKEKITIFSTKIHRKSE